MKFSSFLQGYVPCRKPTGRGGSTFLPIGKGAAPLVKRLGK